jgi:hypothetical protein
VGVQAACVRVCMRVRARQRASARGCAHACLSAWVCTHKHKKARTHVCVCLCVRACASRVCLSPRAIIYAYIYIYVYVYIYIYMHACMYICMYVYRAYLSPTCHILNSTLIRYPSGSLRWIWIEHTSDQHQTKHVNDQWSTNVRSV